MDLTKVVEFLSNPLVQMGLAMVLGWLTKIAWDVAATYLRYRGKRDMERAQIALLSAKLTPDGQDDVVAEMALRRAEESKEFLDMLADRLEVRRKESDAQHTRTGAALPLSQKEIADAAKNATPEPKK